MSKATAKPVIFITGAFIANNCWDEWKGLFEKQGYRCLAPAWPHKDEPAEDLRNKPERNPIATNTLASLTDYFASLVIDLPEKPILIGHSTGGLIVQLLLQRNLGAAGVAVHSFPPRGINRSRLSLLRAMWEMMMLFSSGRKTYLISFRNWCRYIANGMSEEEKKKTYYEYAIPESKKIIRDILKCAGRIDFKKSHAPLLLLSGSSDSLVPASLNYDNYRKYSRGYSITDYKEFKGHNHLVFSYPSSLEEAEFIIRWLKDLN